jgi:hypothetical protein
MISTGSTFNTFNMVKRNTFYKECMEREEEEEEEERKITGSSRLRRPPVAGGCGCCRRRWRQLGEVEKEVPMDDRSSSPGRTHHQLILLFSPPP